LGSAQRAAAIEKDDVWPGRKKKTMHEDEGNIDHTQTLGGHVRLQVGLSPSQAYIVAYFKESKNCNGKI
jgi:hypothetical protein